MKGKLIYDIQGDEASAEFLASKTLPLLKNRPVLLLYGDLGSGKTTFCKKLLKQAGYTGEVSSPTFNIVNEYKLKDGSIVFHFDLYRISHIAELEEIGFSEYLESGNPCIIEWPEIAYEYFNMTHLRLQIRYEENGRNYLLEEVVVNQHEE